MKYGHHDLVILTPPIWQTPLKMLADPGPVMRGNVVLIGTRKKQYYFSLNKGKKTHIIYPGKKRMDRAKEYSDNYKKLLEIVEEITVLNTKFVKKMPVFNL